MLPCILIVKTLDSNAFVDCDIEVKVDGYENNKETANFPASVPSKNNFETKPDERDNIEKISDLSAHLLSNLSVEKLLESTFQLISDLHADPTVTNKQIQNVTSKFDSFLNSPFVNDLKDLILFNTNKNMSLKVRDEFESFQSISKKINTQHKRLAHLEGNKLYIKPKFVKFGSQSREKKRKRSNSDSWRSINFFGFSAKNFFELPNIFDQTHRYYCGLLSNSDVISNVIQINFWRNTIQKAEGSIVYPLYIFVDAFETGNPLGPNAGKNKLNGVYTSVACLPPEHRSKLSNSTGSLLMNLFRRPRPS